jgi:RimK family alpha-L-glutamate ligase
MRLALIAHAATPTNDGLCRARTPLGSWERLTPETALRELRAGDAALSRLDVRPTLDGIEEGLWAHGALAARGVVVLNEPSSLLAAHDKLLTARLLRRAGVPHPRTRHVRDGRPAPLVQEPVVVKPRFGSWGQGVERFRADELETHLQELRARSWFLEHGALVQELVPPCGYDLRIVVAVGRVVGAVYRVAPEGEWRTNVALGGVRRSVDIVPRQATALALEAAEVVGADLVGVDLLPDGDGGWIVIEINGAVEFSPEYLSGDVFGETATILAEAARRRGSGAAEPAVAASDPA